MPKKVKAGIVHHRVYGLEAIEIVAKTMHKLEENVETDELCELWDVTITQDPFKITITVA